MLNKLNVIIAIIILGFFLSLKYSLNCSWFESLGIIFMMFALGFIKSAQNRQIQEDEDKHLKKLIKEINQENEK